MLFSQLTSDREWYPLNSRLRHRVHRRKDPRRLVIEPLEERRLLASVSGRVFLDSNGDAADNDSAGQLVGFSVFVDENGNGDRDPNESLAVTDLMGEYQLEVPVNVPVEITSLTPDDWELTSPLPGRTHTVTATDAAPIDGLDFGIRFVATSWFNSFQPTNVNVVDGTSPLDALLVINELDLRTVSDPDNGDLEPLSAPPDPLHLYDVDNSGCVSPLDALLVINYLTDRPIATDDHVTTDKDTPITFDVRADNGNGVDSDPDSGESVNVSRVDATSAQGAMVTLNSDGTVTYNPITSVTLQGLAADDAPIVDTFSYTITDGSGATDTAIVSVTVTGVAEQTITANLSVYVDSQPVTIPAGAGDPASGDADIHTHDDTGLIDIHPQGPRSDLVQLGEFFNAWDANPVPGSPATIALSNTQLFDNFVDVNSSLQMFVNGIEVTDEFSEYQIRNDDNIVLVYGSNPVISFNTNAGSIPLELLADEAPNTVDNFLNYVNGGADGNGYAGTILHRSIPDLAIIGGGFRPVSQTTTKLLDIRGPLRFQPANNFSRHIPELSGIAIERSPGDRSNSFGTLAGIASRNGLTSQFVFNTGDNAFLDDRGFTVFAVALGAATPGGQPVANATLNEIADFTTVDVDRSNDNGGTTLFPDFDEVPYTPEGELVAIQSVSGNGTVRGRVFADQNQDGVLNNGETGLAGRTVFSDANGNGLVDVDEASTFTDANGDYALSLDAGTHMIRQPTVSWENQTAPLDPDVFTLDIEIGREFDDVRFGNFAVGEPVPNAVDDFFADFVEGSVDILLDVLANDLFIGDTNETLRITAVGTASQGGTVTIGGDGDTLLYTPAPSFNGPETFTYTVQDRSNATAPTSQGTVTVTVEPLNFAPSANNDSFTAIQGTTLNVSAAQGVLVNDSDPENDSLTAVVASNPNNGRLTLNADGSFAYEPNANFSGTDSFTYTANDGSLSSNEATVEVTVRTVQTETATLSATKDATLYERADGSVANGAGQYFFAGKTLEAANTLRRGLIAFDVAGGVPAGATIMGVTLELNMSRTIVDEFEVHLHRVTTDWNQGTSDQIGEEGGKFPEAPTAGDATWIHSAFGSGMWNTPGGDFESTPAATTPVNRRGAYQWSSSQMVANVQDWLDDPSQNFGWAVLTDEVNISAKRFDSRENPNVLNRPRLIVTYTTSASSTAPSASNDSFSTSEGVTLNIPAAQGVLANDSDPENDSLTAAVVSNPSNGSLTLNPDGSFSYAPNANFTGADTFTYRASDGELTSNVATVSITVNSRNTAPSASNDSYSTGAGQTLTVSAATGILANDSDPENDILTAAVVSNPTGGTLTLNADGSFTYVPNANFRGADTFTYRASDGELSSNTATATVTVGQAQTATLSAFKDTTLYEHPTGGNTNGAGERIFAGRTAEPVNSLRRGLIAFDVAADIPAGATITDVTLQLFMSRTIVQPYDVTLYRVTTDWNQGTTDQTGEEGGAHVTPPSTGDATWIHSEYPNAFWNTPGGDFESTPLATTSVGTTGEYFQWNSPELAASIQDWLDNPTQNFGWILLGDETVISAKRFDSSENTNPATRPSLTVTYIVPGNTAPTAAADSYSVDEDQTLNVNAATGVLANDSDADNDSLTATVTDNVDNGQLTFNSDGSFSYTPNADYNGTDSFTYTVGDGQLSAVGTVDITVNPVDEPQASSVTLVSSQDTTLIESADGERGNGAGTGFIAGKNNGNAFTLRRGLVEFDLASAGIPAGATITNVELTLNMSQTTSGAADIALHRVTSDWGEGASSGGGSGAQAQTNDATWLHAFYAGARWDTAGGDFNATASAITSVDGIGSYSWSSAQLIADVQSWLADPSSNFGWILIGDETIRSSKRFDSREHAEPENRPQLKIEFEL